MTPLSRRKTQLTTRAADLNARLAGIESSLDELPAKDWEDLATERADDEVLESLGTAGQQELRQIAAALTRIEAGTYGTCTRCGDQIAEARLDLLPYTPFCAACAA